MWASLSFNEKPNTLSGWTWHCKLLFLNIYELEELILYSICWSDSLQVMAQFIDQKKKWPNLMQAILETTKFPISWQTIEPTHWVGSTINRVDNWVIICPPYLGQAIHTISSLPKIINWQFMRHSDLDPKPKTLSTSLVVIHFLGENHFVVRQRVH